MRPVNPPPVQPRNPLHGVTLEAMLTARARATSLARFMISGQVNRMGVVIEDGAIVETKVEAAE